MLVGLLLSLVAFGVQRSEQAIRKCYKPVDVVLLLDSSGSLGLANWIKELNFANSLLQNFDISEYKTHVGLIDFSMVAKKHLELSDNRQDLSNVNRVIDELKDESHYQNGMTNTDYGLIEAIEMFERSKQRLVPQILIVVTDGKTTWRDGKNGLQLITPHAQKLAAKGVKAFAMAIGDDIKDEELNAITGAPERVMKVENFVELINKVNSFTEMACPDCPIRFKKVGCYKDNQVPPRPLEIYALTARDPQHANFTGITIDWTRYEEFLKDFVCRCAKRSTSLQNKYFGIQFYGECWTSGFATYNRDGESEVGGCVNSGFRPCAVNEQICTGISHRNQVYEIDEEPFIEG